MAREKIIARIVRKERKFEKKNFNDPSALIFDIYFRYFKARS